MDTALQPRRAIEALRAGVPNRDAVQALGFAHEGLLQVFEEKVGSLHEGMTSDEQPQGILIAAEFGAGKSHALEYLSCRALERRCAVSRVVISKETQLFDPLKVFRASVRTLRVPDRKGDALEEIVFTRLGKDAGRFDALCLWLRQGKVNSRFNATIRLYEDARSNPELHERLAHFWAGGRLNVTQLKRDLRACGAAGVYPLEKISSKELARQHFAFMARLIYAAGYSGWVILLDELELMSRYSVLQRGRSYAELARLFGLYPKSAMPGLLTVGTITKDYEYEMLERRDDVNQIGFRLRSRGDAESELAAALAEKTMDFIRKPSALLPEPDQDKLRLTWDRLKTLYAEAYGSCPEESQGPTKVYGWQMREHIRSWITAWDLRRLDPAYRADVVVNRMGADYTEDRVMEESSGSEDDEEAVG
ncbi:MAG: DUF2791 family P-loop domain-containing protein [Actinomycetia bacterium]|nr:DUF2791 family P-loop domain-containing protein [Actinomycetes bacterium]